MFIVVYDGRVNDEAESVKKKLMVLVEMLDILMLLHSAKKNVMRQELILCIVRKKVSKIKNLVLLMKVCHLVLVVVMVIMQSIVLRILRNLLRLYV